MRQNPNLSLMFVTIILITSCFDLKSGTLYVDSINGDDTRTYLEAQNILTPLKTIHKGMEIVQAGDSLLIRGGTYQGGLYFYHPQHMSGIEKLSPRSVTITAENLVNFEGMISNITLDDVIYIHNSKKSNNGVYEIVSIGDNFITVHGSPFNLESAHVKASVGLPIVFRNYQNERVVINGVPDNNHICISLEGKYDSGNDWGAGLDYLIFEGLEFQNFMDYGIHIARNSDHNICRNCIFKDVFLGIEIWGKCDYNMVIECEFHVYGTEGVYIGVSQMGWGEPTGYVPGEKYTENSSVHDSSHYNHIIDNFITGATENAIESKMRTIGTVVEGNKIENVQTYNWNGIIMIGSECDHTFVYNNLIKNCTGPTTVRHSAILVGTSTPVTDVHIFNNVIDTFRHGSGISIMPCSGIYVLHNTIYKAKQGIELNDDPTLGSGAIVRNNILSENELQFYLPWESADNYVVSHNLIHGVTEYTGMNAILCDPLFQNAIEGDLALKRHSAAINAVVHEYIDFDFNYQKRNDSSSDFGAYEYDGPDPVLVKSKIFLQGPFNKNLNLMNTDLNQMEFVPAVSPYADQISVTEFPEDIVDWINVQLYDESFVAQKSAFINKDGYLIDIDGSMGVKLDADAKSYYLIIKHRNHLFAKSAEKLSLDYNTSQTYDFTISKDQYYYPYSAVYINNSWLIASGDINDDGLITTEDYVLWYNDHFSQNNGYLNSDLDFNSFIDINDYNIWFPNAQKHINSYQVQIY